MTATLPLLLALILISLRCIADAQLIKQVFVHYLPWYDATGERYPARTGWCYPDSGNYDCTDTSVIHYSNVPLIGEYTQFDNDVLEYHFLTIFVTGIDGIIININPANSLQKELSLVVLNKLVSMKSSFPSFDLKVIVSYDDGSSITDQTLITTYMQWVYDNIYGNPTYSSLIFKDDSNKPVLVFWSESDNAHYWTTAQSLFSGNVLVVIRNALNFQYSDVNFEWINYLNTGKPLSNTVNWGRQYFDDFDFIMARQTENGVSADTINLLKMGGVYPGFDDQNVPPFWNGGTNRYHLRNVADGETMELTWQQQISYTPLRLFGTDSVQNPWIQIATWNDWPEGTSIEPATADTYGYTALETNRRKIAEFKSISAAFESACLNVPFDIYTGRKSASSDSADAAVIQLLSGNCALQSPSPSTSLTASPSPTPSLTASASASPSVSSPPSSSGLPLSSHSPSASMGSSPTTSPASTASSSPSPFSSQTFDLTSSNQPIAPSSSPSPSLSQTLDLTSSNQPIAPSSSPSPSLSQTLDLTSSNQPIAPSSSPSVSETNSASPSPTTTVSTSGVTTATRSSSPTSSPSASPAGSMSPTPSPSSSPTPSPRCPCKCTNSNLGFDVQNFVRNCRATNSFSRGFGSKKFFGDSDIFSLCENELRECSNQAASNLQVSDGSLDISDFDGVGNQMLPNGFIDDFF